MARVARVWSARAFATAPLVLCVAALLAPQLLSPAASLPIKLPSGQAAQVSGPAPDVADFARAGCDNFTSDQWQPLRPAFHITVPYGWMNDPHGMFQHTDGRVHLFFQYNPRALAWGAPLWGHVVSEDLARWTWLPPALLPDTAYDFNGVWSGAATVTDGGLPVLTYTAASTHAPEMGNFFQRQAMALPADINGSSDPLLKRWVKPASNPFLVQVPPGGTSFQFRDPTEARHAVWEALTSQDNPRPLPAGHFALAVGAQAYCMGGAGIYSAPSMAGPWTYEGSLYNQMVPEPQVDGQCLASRTTSPAAQGPAFGGPCDQFGAHCRMWEVVDFAALDGGVYFLKWDDQSRFRDLFSMEWYVLGNGPWDYTAIHPDLAGTAGAAGSALSGSGSGSGRRQGPFDSTSSSRGGVFGLQYSGYPNASTLDGAAAAAATAAAAAAAKGRQRGGGSGGGSAAGGAADFNNIGNWDRSATRSLFRGQLDGQRFAPMRTDYGSTYASMVFRTRDRRQIMFSWIYETAAGCEDMCSDQTPDVVARQGFKGVQTLPRQLSYDGATKTLRAYPAVEVERLRGQQVVNATHAALATFPAVTQLLKVGKVPGAAGTNSSVSSSSSSSSSSGRGSTNSTTARQLEVRASFTLLPPGSSSTGGGSSTAEESGGRTRRSANRILQRPDEFALGVRIELGSGRYADVYVKGSVASLAPASPGYAVASLSVWVDRSQAGGGANTSFVEGGPVPLPAGHVGGGQACTAPDTPLALDVWVDHGVLEVFAMGGLGRVTSRIYPAGDDVAWGVSAWALPPEPTAGLPHAVDRAAAARAAEAIRPPSAATAVYCWWCRLWVGRQCGDMRCFAGWEKWPAPGDWGVVADARVWEVRSAWLAPSC